MSLLARAQQLARNAQAFAEQARHFEWIDEDPSLTLEMARGDSDNVVLDSIKHRCDVLWAELVDVQVQIDAQCGQEQGQQPVVSEQKQLLDVMETRLASELESLRLGSSYKPHKQETIIQLEMEQQLQRSIAELAQTQSVLQTDTHSARAEVTRLTAQRAELSDEQAKLQVHLDEGRLADSEASTKYGASFTVSINTRSRQSAERELNQKIRQSAEQNSALLKQMVAFIDKYFPIVTVPVSSGATGQKKRKGANGSVDENETLQPLAQPQTQAFSLKSLLEDLMNLAVTKPSDPYVSLQLSTKHWPPHVELLIRAGIAVKHPKDGSRLRLVEFHM